MMHLEMMHLLMVFGVVMCFLLDGFNPNRRRRGWR